MKSFLEMTVKEQIESCDRMLNVLAHHDWQEVYLMLSEAAENFRKSMETAATWEIFVAERAKYEYIRDVLLPLPETFRNLKNELELPEISSNEISEEFNENEN